ncbi:hypothetical protein TRVL_08957 [Trypanosoma vivax]|nr:hypothetical protein TRVL_08957 [Trypanosoma vivax]
MAGRNPCRRSRQTILSLHPYFLGTLPCSLSGAHVNCQTPILNQTSDSRHSGNDPKPKRPDGYNPTSRFKKRIRAACASYLRRIARGAHKLLQDCSFPRLP